MRTVPQSTAKSKSKLAFTDPRHAPEPTSLVADVLPTRSLVGLYGEPGIGKSFVALDLAHCLAAGIPWHGHAVKQSGVVYVTSDRVSTVGVRTRAWVRAFGPIGSCMRYGLEGKLYAATDLDRLMDSLNELDTTELVVIDVLSFVDIKRVVAAADRLRCGSGSTVLITHYDDFKQATAALDVVFRLHTDNFDCNVSDLFDLSCEKGDTRPYLEFERVPCGPSCVLRTLREKLRARAKPDEDANEIDDR
jgi:hypothetical protein